MKIIEKVRHSIRDYYVLYADSLVLQEKAEKLLRPLPQGCELVKLTEENKNRYKSKWNVGQMLQAEGEAWAIVYNNDEIIAYHFGTYRGKTSLFFKVKNCDFEHIELMVDEKYRRKGLAIYLLYHLNSAN